MSSYCVSRISYYLSNAVTSKTWTFTNILLMHEIMSVLWHANEIYSIRWDHRFSVIVINFIHFSNEIVQLEARQNGKENVSKMRFN